MREENGTKEQLANELTAMRQRVAELEAILEGSETLEQVARAVSSGLNLETTLETIYGQVQRIMPVDAFYVALYDEDTQLITYPLVYDQHQRYEESPFPLPRTGKLDRVLDTGEPLLINRTPEEVDAIVMRPETAIGNKGRSSASLLYVPLYVGSQLVGVMSAQSYRFNAYDQRDMTLLSGIASHAAIAIENARLYDEAQQRVVELETLRHTSLQLTSLLDLSAVLNSVAESVLALVGATDCLVYLYDEASEGFTFGTALGRWATRGSIVKPRRSGLTATVARERRPVVIDDAVGHPLYASPEAQQWNIQAIAGFPLQRGGRLLGVLHVAFADPHVFREEELRVLGLLVDRAAIAIENARLFEAERMQLEELTVLHAVAAAGAKATGEDVLIERVTRIIGETLYPDVFGVMLLDESANALRLHPSYQISEDAKRIVVPVGQGITGTVAADGQPRRVGDVTLAPEYIDAGVGTASELCVPLKVGERVIGVINAESAQQDAFSEADERLLATVAGQLATAIEKVRLYEEAQQEIAERVRVEEELRKHRDHLEELVEERTAALTEANAQLQQEIVERRRAEAERERLLVAERRQARRQAALFRLSSELAATLDEAEVCHRVVDGLHDTLDYDILALYLVDETTGDRVLANVVGFVNAPTRISPGQGLSERPLLDGQLHYTPDVTQDPRYFHGVGGSEVDVPVRIGGRVLGVLIAENKQRHAFSQDDFEVLSAAAQQAGLAIEKARLLAAERQRADELDALRTTMANITAELELSALLQAIVQRAAGLLDATGGELGLYDQANQEIQIVVSHSMGKDYVGTRMALGEGAMGRVAETGEPLIIADYQTWEGRAPQYADVAMHAGLTTPLLVGSRLVGTITIADAHLDRRFNPADLHLLNLFAQQAAIAIENARLFKEVRVRAEELAVLNELAQAFTTQLNVNGVLDEVYRGVSRLLDTTNFYIALYDPEKGEVSFPINVSESLVDRQITTMPAGQGLTGYIIRNHTSVLIKENAADRLEEIGIELIGEVSLSYLGVPLMIGDRVLGMMAIQSFTTPRLYDEHDQDLLVSIASQAAIAIENARLFDQAQQEIAERVRAEAELREYQEHLEELVEERTADLRESEERYRTLFDRVPVGLYRTTPAGRFVNANLALVQMLGFPSQSAILASNSANLYAAPEERVRWQALMEQEGVVRDFECQVRRADGRLIWVNDSGRAVRDEKGQVLYYEGSVEDITERKQAQQKLQESEEEFRTLYEATRDAVMLLDDKSFFDCNPATLKIFGCETKKQFVGKHPSEFSPEYQPDNQDSASLSAQRIETALCEGSCFFEWQHKRLDGTEFPAEVLLSAMEIRGRKVLQAVVRDITERKRAEAELQKYREHLEELVEERTAELRESEERYRTLFNGVPVGLYLTTPTGHIMDINLAAVQMFGFPSKEFALTTNAASFYVDPQDRMRWQALMEREGVVRDFETQIYRHDGAVMWVNDTARAAKDEQGQVLYYEGSLEDITERKQAEEALYLAKEAAEAANQAKSTFLANMSHELRTPLNAIIGFTRLVTRRSRGLLPERQLDNLEKVLVSADQLLELINAVLDLSKIEAGRIDVHPVAFNVAALIDVCLQTVRQLVRGEPLRLVKEIEPDLPLLYTDQDKVRQILINLLSNAVKFTKEGTIAVTAQRQGETLVLAVADTGIGIPEQALERIFEAFQQVDGSTTRRYGGTGLGLSISRHLAQLLGGDVTVESVVGVGSTFTVTVPIRYGAARPATTSAPLSEAPSEAATAQPKDGQVVLAIDDDPSVIYLLRENLAEAGFRVVGAPDGQEGLQKAQALKPLAIILDILMPFKDGWQVLHELKADAATRDIPVVILSIVDDKELGYRLGAFDYLVKPFDQEAILSTLARIPPLQRDPHPIHLLVVDDDPQVVDLVRQILEGEPYEVRSASDGQEALKVISQQPPDIILLDLLMPRLDGFGVIEQLQQTPQHCDIPIIVLTAKTLADDEITQLQRSVSKVVQKRALEREVLIQELRKALQVYRRSSVL